MIHDTQNVVILGDVNVNMLKTNMLTDWLDINGFKNIIKEPTCFKGQPSLIDVVITNVPKRFQKSISVDTGLRDFHKMVCVCTKLHVPQQKTTTITYRSYTNFHREDYLYDLCTAPFHVSEIFDDIEDAYSFWDTLMRGIVDEHAPLKQRKIKGNSTPYMNGELRRAINVKNMLTRKYDKCNSIANWENYRKHRNLVTKLRKKSIQRLIQNKCNEANDRGGFWKAVKPLISKNSIGKDDNIFIMNNGTIENHPEALCQIFNNYFVNIAISIGPDDAILEHDTSESCTSSHANHRSVKSICESMSTKPNTTGEFEFSPVGAMIMRERLMKAKKATGHDRLPAKLLKIRCDILC